MKKEISVNQLSIFVFIIFMTNKLLILPSLIYQDLKINAIFSIGAMLLIDAVLIFFALRFVKKSDKTFFEAISLRLGKVFSKVFFCLIIIFFLFKFVFVFNETYTFLKSLVYENYEFVLFLIIFLVACFVLAKNGINSLARTGEIAFLVIAACFGLVLFSSFFADTISPSLPYFKFDLSVINSVYKYIFFFSDAILIFMFAGKVKVLKSHYKKTYISLGLSILTIFFISVLFYFNYPITAGLHKNAITDVTQFVPVLSDIVGLEVFAIVGQCMLSFLQGGLILWAIFGLTNNVINKNSTWIDIAILIVLTIISYIFIFNLEVATLVATSGFNIFTIILLIVVLLLLIKTSFKEAK